MTSPKRDAHFLGKLLLCVYLAIVAAPLLVVVAIGAGIHQGKFSAVRLVIAIIVFAGGLAIRFVMKRESPSHVYIIEDMRSRCGTLVNGTRIPGRTQLEDG